MLSHTRSDTPDKVSTVCLVHDTRQFGHKGHFALGGIFGAERHFLLFKDQLAESGRQKTKENIILRGKFRLVENDPKSDEAFIVYHTSDKCISVTYYHH